MAVRKSESVNERGFSLVELVVAVGILAILSLVGVVAYSGFTNMSKTNAVAGEASKAYKKVLAYAVDGNSATDPMSVADEYNVQSVRKGGKEAYYIHTEDLGNERYKVTAFLSDTEPTAANFAALIASAEFFKVMETPVLGDGSGNSEEKPDDDTVVETPIVPPIVEAPLVPNFDLAKALTPIESETCTTNPANVKIKDVRAYYDEYTTKNRDETTNQVFLVEFVMEEAVTNCFTLDVDMNNLPITPKTDILTMKNGWGTAFKKEQDKWTIKGVRSNNTFAKNEKFVYQIDGGNYDYKTIVKSQVAQSDATVTNDSDGLKKSITFNSNVDFIANWKTEVDLSNLVKNGQSPLVSKVYKTDGIGTVGNHFTLTPVSGKPGFYTIENTDKQTALPGSKYDRTIVFRAS